VPCPARALRRPTRHTGGVIRRRLVVRGAVQGVGFRWACAEEAERLGVRGWVRNLPGGPVEVVAEGEPGAVDALVAWANEGPSFARVTAVDVHDEPAEGLTAFAIRR